jgi:hypothetical protein
MVGRLSMQVEISKKIRELCQLAAQAQRGVMQELMEQQGCSVQMACAALGLPRCTYYYRLQRRDENPLGAAVEALAGQFATYGTRQITHQLR